MKTRKLWVVYQGKELICLSTSRKSALIAAGVYTKYGDKYTDKELKDRFNVTCEEVLVTFTLIDNK